MNTKNFTAIEYSVSQKDRIAYIRLNRPLRYNAINDKMPLELKEAVILANLNKNVSVIILSGNGKYFCSGYDLQGSAESSRNHPCNQKLPWDPYLDYTYMGNNNYPSGCTACWMSLFNSKKPTIAMIHGGAIGGGSDIALCCDFIFMTCDSVIGYPPVRLWGVPTTAMWVQKCGIQQAKRILLTGDKINGIEAKRIGISLETYKNKNEMIKNVLIFAKRISNIPLNQLWFNKLVINNIANNMYGSIEQIQTLASILDGASRHTPEGIAWQKMAKEKGFKKAVKFRDGNNNLNINNIPFNGINKNDIKSQMKFSNSSKL